ncbi:hypothetical protein [Escherichia coli]
MSQSQIEQQLAQALREVETEREALRRLLQTLKSEYEQTRRDNRKLREQVEQLSEDSGISASIEHLEAVVMQMRQEYAHRLSRGMSMSR